MRKRKEDYEKRKSPGLVFELLDHYLIESSEEHSVYSYFSHKEIEIQGSSIKCPWTLSKEVPGLGFEPRCLI